MDSISRVNCTLLGIWEAAQCYTTGRSQILCNLYTPGTETGVSSRAAHASQNERLQESRGGSARFQLREAAQR